MASISDTVENQTDNDDNCPLQANYGDQHKIFETWYTQ